MTQGPGNAVFMDQAACNTEQIYRNEKNGLEGKRTYDGTHPFIIQSFWNTGVLCGISTDIL